MSQQQGRSGGSQQPTVARSAAAPAGSRGAPQIPRDAVPVGGNTGRGGHISSGRGRQAQSGGAPVLRFGDVDPTVVENATKNQMRRGPATPGVTLPQPQPASAEQAANAPVAAAAGNHALPGAAQPAQGARPAQGAAQGGARGSAMGGSGFHPNAPPQGEAHPAAAHPPPGPGQVADPRSFGRGGPPRGSPAGVPPYGTHMYVYPSYSQPHAPGYPAVQQSWQPFYFQQGFPATGAMFQPGAQYAGQPAHMTSPPAPHAGGDVSQGMAGHGGMPGAPPGGGPPGQGAQGLTPGAPGRGHQGMGMAHPGAMPGGMMGVHGGVSPVIKTPVPLREKRVLKITNPLTNEELDLSKLAISPAKRSVDASDKKGAASVAKPSDPVKSADARPEAKPGPAAKPEPAKPELAAKPEPVKPEPAAKPEPVKLEPAAKPEPAKLEPAKPVAEAPEAAAQASAPVSGAERVAAAAAPAEKSAPATEAKKAEPAKPAWGAAGGTSFRDKLAEPAKPAPQPPAAPVAASRPPARPAAPAQAAVPAQPAAAAQPAPAAQPAAQPAAPALSTAAAQPAAQPAAVAQPVAPPRPAAVPVAASAPVAPVAPAAPAKAVAAPVAAPPAEEESKEPASTSSNGEAPDAPPAGFVLFKGRKRYMNDYLFYVRQFWQHPPKDLDVEAVHQLMDAGSGREERGGGQGWGRGGGGGGGGRAGHRGLPSPGAGANVGAGFGQGDRRHGGQVGGHRGRPPPPITGADANVWQRGQALPPLPSGERGHFGGGGRRGPVALHRTGSAYRIGALRSDDPEEEKAQKALKAMLNKITPDNFDRISTQIVEHINERAMAVTLQGFIDQIFDKALTEPPFSELYATLVKELKARLRELRDEEGEAVEFRRALLNKCQEEFEEGVVAMKAVAERERHEREAPEKEDEEEEAAAEDAGAEAGASGESGDEAAALTREQKLEARRREIAAAAAEVQARKRMLGNIIFVGQLYRQGVLTEKVMHSCIQQLLDETENPRPEDVECLAKLVTTVGKPLDLSNKVHQLGEQQTATTQELMDMYFKRIGELSKSSALDSRHKFMLRDLVDLRSNNWVQRQKAEGPKKIGDIHRDAENEAKMRALMDRQPNRGMRDMPRDRPPMRPYMDNRVDAPIRIMNRVGSSDALGAGGQSFRPHGRPAPMRDNRQTPERPGSASPDRRPSPAPAPTPATPAELKRKAHILLEEWAGTKDEEETAQSLKEMLDVAEGRNVVAALLGHAIFKTGSHWEAFKALFRTEAFKAAMAQFVEDGVRALLDTLEDELEDKPKATRETGELLSVLMEQKLVELKPVAEYIPVAATEKPADGDTPLVDSGNAAKVVGALLQQLQEILGAEKTKALWQGVGMSLQQFMPSFEKDDAAQVDKLCLAYSISAVVT